MYPSNNYKRDQFSENLAISIDVLSVHFDPELWGPVDTEKFYPDR